MSQDTGETQTAEATELSEKNTEQQQDVPEQTEDTQTQQENAAIAQAINTREQLEKKFNMSRNNLLAVIAFTCINLILALTNSDLYFLFSASIPLILLYLGSEFVWHNGTIMFSAIGIAAAFTSVSLYGVFWILSKNYRAWIIGALVYFSIDILVSLLFLFVLADGIEAFSIIELVFLAWIMYYLITGTVTWSKLRKLPVYDESLLSHQNLIEAEQIKVAAEHRTIPIAQIPPSTAIRRPSKRGKVLASHNYNNVEIIVKRSASVTELIINDMVYAEKTGLHEKESYTLEANVYNVIINATMEIPSLTTQFKGVLPTLYLYVNGNLTASKVRHY